MFNIQPGQGLGLIASKEIAFGLGTPFEVGISIWVEVLRGLSIITMALGLDTKSEIMQFIAGDTAMEEIENIEGDSEITQTIEATTPMLEDD